MRGELQRKVQVVTKVINDKSVGPKLRGASSRQRAGPHLLKWMIVELH